MLKGKIKYFNELKGFGFIASNEGDIFFHISDYRGCRVTGGGGVKFYSKQISGTPVIGHHILFKAQKTPKGKKAKLWTFYGDWQPIALQSAKSAAIDEQEWLLKSGGGCGCEVWQNGLSLENTL